MYGYSSAHVQYVANRQLYLTSLLDTITLRIKILYEIPSKEGGKPVLIIRCRIVLKESRMLERIQTPLLSGKLQSKPWNVTAFPGRRGKGCVPVPSCAESRRQTLWPRCRHRAAQLCRPVPNPCGGDGHRLCPPPATHHGRSAQSSVLPQLRLELLLGHYVRMQW
ncbi:hypothetical protein C8J57DRAFT_1224764 [Mycena rebaudengoi]|nr:hypothetical protein C8J57DRAFT_1224764 [Mycena rebaudengoi]